MTSKVSIAAYYLRMFLERLKTSMRARIPERILLSAAYVSNIVLLILQHLFLRNIGETGYILLVDIIVALQMFIPVFIMDVIPLYHYLVLVGVVVAGTVLNLVPKFTIYYYILASIAPISLLKLEPILVPQSPLVIKVATKIRRATKKARAPRDINELVFTLKISMAHVAGFIISTAIYVLKGYMPAIFVAIYSLVALGVFIFNVGASPSFVAPRKKKYSLTLLFVMKYPFLYRIANKLKMKLHPLTERAGVLIYEFAYVAKYLAIFIWYLMTLPTLALVAYVFIPYPFVLIAFVLFVAVGVIIWYMPFIVMTSKIHARRNIVEKEYPIFLAYATALVSAGYSLYSVFKDLVRTKGTALFKGFSNEAKFLVALVDKQGLPELRALEHYAATHPSSDFRNFVLGYIHQRQLGGRVLLYMEQKLMEALDSLKRRMERYVNQVVTFTEITLIVLTLPTLPLVVGFIIAPDIVYNMLILQMVVFVPGIGLMFYSIASAIQLEFKDEYKLTYVPSVIGAIVGLMAALALSWKNIIAGASIVIAGAALGHYIEYMKDRRVFSEIEKTLPQLFRDLSELRHMMPVAEALSRMSEMGYPKHVSRILRRMSVLRGQGVKIIEQPWHSRSWFWRFTQFLLGKIEESGGGSVQLFRQLMLFFMEFNNIMSSVRANLKLYEIVIYAIPVIFALVSYSTIGIFVNMTSMTKYINVEEISELGSVASQFPQFLRLFQGIDPMILTLTDLVIFETSFVLGLLCGKITYGTIKDTRALAIVMIITAMLVSIGPQMAQLLLQYGQPLTGMSGH